MKSERACYFCTTPYQIIGAINLVKSRQEIADIYIVNQFANCKVVAKRLENKCVFKRIIIIDEKNYIGKLKTSRNKRLSHLYMLYYYFKANTIALEILTKDSCYKKMYFTSQAYIIRLIYFYFLKKNKEMEFIIFDDGIGTYLNTKIFSVNKTDKFFRAILFGRKSYIYDYEKILFEPQLYQAGEQNNQLSQLPKITQDYKTKLFFNYIFEFGEKDVPLKNIIYFDTIFNEIESDVDVGIYIDVYSRILSFFEDEILIKKHPRSKNRTLGNNFYKNTDMPAELIYLNSDCSIMTLIAYNSTAVIMPKILFDAEPTVILLYKVMAKVQRTTNSDIFYEKCKALYKSPEKFFIPKSVNELEDILINL